MTQLLNASDFYFVLVRPVYLGNIGSVARLMKNFGFSNLRLVDAPRNYKDAEARKMSVGAFDILKKSEVFSALPDAIADMHLVMATSSGQQRNLPLLTLTETISKTSEAGPSNKIAIVLGDERNGLSNEELHECHLITRIETNPDFPSLNVAQAACVIAYEFSKICTSDIQQQTSGSLSTLPSATDDDQLFKLIAELLEDVDFSRSFNKSLTIKQLRRFYHRALPTKRENDLLRGVMHKLNQSLKTER